MPGSSVHGILQARVLEWVAILLEWVAIPFSRDLPNAGIEPGYPALQTDSLLSEPLGKSIHIGVEPFPSPGDLPNPGIEPRFPALQADSLPPEPPGQTL